MTELIKPIDQVRADTDDDPDPVERLRYFCSLALKPDDWLDVEELFNAVTAEREEARAEVEKLRAAAKQALNLLESAHIATALIWPRYDCVEALHAALKEPK